MAIEKLSYNGDSKVIKHICTVINALIDSGGGGGSTASSVSYDNTVSGLTATDVQDAIDEVVADIPTDFVPASTGGTFSGNVTIDRANGTISTVGNSVLLLGNNKGSGTDKNSKGSIGVYSSGGKKLDLSAIDNLSTDRYIIFPDSDGYVALTSDIPTNVAHTNTDNNFSTNQTIDRANGTAGTVGYSQIVLGNNKASSVAGNSSGTILTYSNSGTYAAIRNNDSQTSNIELRLPTSGGTLALTTDLGFTNFQTLSNGVKYAKSGNLMMMRGSFGTAVTVSGGSLSLGTLPAGYRPSVKQYIPCGAELQPALLLVNTDGTCYLETARTSAFYLALNTIIAL